MKYAYLWVLLLLWSLPAAHAQQFDAAHVFQLFNRNSHLSLDMTGGSYAEGAAAQQELNNGTAAQHWRLVKYNTDPNSPVYWIINRGSGKALELSGGQDADGVRITQTTKANLTAQLWSIVLRTPGVPADGYLIRTLVASRTLEIEDSSPLRGAKAQVWTYANLPTQQWDIVDRTADYQRPYARWGVYRIRNVNSGKLLEVNNGTSTEGEPVQQWADEGFTHQLWSFDWVNMTSTPGYGGILNRNSGMALEVENNSTANGALVQQNFFNNEPGQMWYLEVYNSSADLVIIRNLSGKVLEIDGSSYVNGARAQQWDRDVNAPGQIWKLEYVSLSRGAAPGVAAATELAPDALNKPTAPEAAKVPLTLYPNPAREALTVSFGSLAKPAATILDVRGRTQPARYRADGRVDVSGLAPGVYVLSVRDGVREYRQRFVKE